LKIKIFSLCITLYKPKIVLSIRFSSRNPISSEYASMSSIVLTSSPKCDRIGEWRDYAIDGVVADW